MSNSVENCTIFLPRGTKKPVHTAQNFVAIRVTIENNFKEIVIADQKENKGYSVTDAAGQQVEVCFEPLTADDLDALNSSDWRGARFGAVWKDWAEHNLALKLVCCDESDPSILGIVGMGAVEAKNGKPDVLRDNLLGTSPYIATRRQADVIMALDGFLSHG